MKNTVIFQNPFKVKHNIINIIMMLLMATVISFIPHDSKILVFSTLILIYVFGIEMFIANRVAKIITMAILLTLLFVCMYCFL